MQNMNNRPTTGASSEAVHESLGAKVGRLINSYLDQDEPYATSIFMKSQPGTQDTIASGFGSDPAVRFYAQRHSPPARRLNNQQYDIARGELGYVEVRWLDMNQRIAKSLVISDVDNTPLEERVSGHCMRNVREDAMASWLERGGAFATVTGFEKLQAGDLIELAGILEDGQADPDGTARAAAAMRQRDEVNYASYSKLPGFLAQSEKS